MIKNSCKWLYKRNQQCMSITYWHFYVSIIYNYKAKRHRCNSDSRVKERKGEGLGTVTEKMTSIVRPAGQTENWIWHTWQERTAEAMNYQKY